MDADDYGLSIRNAALHMAHAAQALARIGRSHWEDDAAACNHFAARSADVGEHLAKAMLGRHGVDFAHMHDIAMLARQAKDAGFPDLAQAVASLNGSGRAPHVAPYGGA